MTHERRTSLQLFEKTIDAFAQALKQMGFLLRNAPIMDGRFHRAPVDGDRGAAKSGAYVAYLDGVPAGYIKNHRTGEQRNWKFAEHRDPLSQADLARLQAQREARERERRAIHKATVRLIARHIEQASPAPADHPYLVQKGVPGYGALCDVVGALEIKGGQEEPQKWSAEGNLILPICDIEGTLVSAQSIGVDGWKVFPRGARWQGGMHRIGSFRGRRPLVVVEGLCHRGQHSSANQTARGCSFQRRESRSRGQIVAQCLPAAPHSHRR